MAGITALDRVRTLLSSSNAPMVSVPTEDLKAIVQEIESLRTRLLSNMAPEEPLLQRNEMIQAVTHADQKAAETTEQFYAELDDVFQTIHKINESAKKLSPKPNPISEICVISCAAFMVSLLAYISYKRYYSSPAMGSLS